jgi:hypothetical protein
MPKKRRSLDPFDFFLGCDHGLDEKEKAVIPEPVSTDGIDADTNKKFWEAFKEVFEKKPDEPFESDEELEEFLEEQEAEEDEVEEIQIDYIELPPKRSKGRPSKQSDKLNAAATKTFCRQIVKFKSRLDFDVSARGWCYILEEYGLLKSDFDRAENIINDCRKTGQLDPGICAEDVKRLADNVEKLDEPDPEAEAQSWIDTVLSCHENYRPLSIWNYQKYFIVMVVEKIDLKSMFLPVCERFPGLEIRNSGGWSDINSRVAMAKQFRYWEERGKQGVLLNCGDFDAGGLNISNFILENFYQLQGATGWRPDRLIIDRFGLNEDFIKLNELTWIDNMRTSKREYPNDLGDPKHPHHKMAYVQDYIRRYCPDWNPIGPMGEDGERNFGGRKCEANSLVVRPDEGRKLCLDAILKYIDPEGVEHWEAETADKRADLKIAVVSQLKERTQNL